jgi:hypothetical protein
VIADVEWNAVTLAGAFILGAVFATLATIRVMRAVFGTVQQQVRRPPPRRDEEAES